MLFWDHIQMLYIHYMYLRRLSQAQNPFRVSHGSPYLPT
ncbi:hypothetical protein MICAH_4220004 [Microcystis aeruginosa PCC 9809]|uniref:Uncharacterized protein n=1 Tax=Microcystis aeruginosa PCC 9809 TaxID=1160285 RepID=I4HY35_MICAE|nr:hypothetical protein MICAH_4220004 [Microcystis aeruginosa PCC 9809]